MLRRVGGPPKPTVRRLALGKGVREVVSLAGEAVSTATVSSSSVGCVVVEDLFRRVDGSGRRVVVVLRRRGSLCLL